MKIPSFVPESHHGTYLKNWSIATRDTGRLFLFAGDQKIEHLNVDFHGENIPAECNTPTHLFEIAKAGHVGCFATHLGLMSRYVERYHAIPYLVKLNGKTNLYTGEAYSSTLHTVEQVVAFAHATKATIVGIGYTVYLGSKHEAKMLAEAAQHIYHAQRHGLLTVLWMYVRAAAADINPRNADIIAGAAGVGHALGADFVKIVTPEGKSPADCAYKLKQAVGAAGSTGVLCAGGHTVEPAEYLTHIQAYLSIARTRGVAVGRNLHQRPLAQAIELSAAISELVYGKEPLAQYHKTAD